MRKTYYLLLILCLFIWFSSCITGYWVPEGKWEKLPPIEGKLGFVVNKVNARILWKHRCQPARKNALKIWLRPRAQYYYIDSGPWVSQKELVYFYDGEKIIAAQDKNGIIKDDYLIPEFREKGFYWGAFWRVFEDTEERVAMRLDQVETYLIIDGRSKGKRTKYFKVNSTSLYGRSTSYYQEGRIIYVKPAL
jgi:hypothetical protein